MSSSPDRNPAPRRRWLSREGFTLIETLVAFTVMATLLSVMFRGVVVMRAGSVAFDQRTHQELVATGLLDQFLARRDLRDGTYSGLQDGRRWTVTAKPVDLTGQLPPDREPDPSTSRQATNLPQTALPAPETPQAPGAPPVPAVEAKPAWRTQRLVIRLETTGRPIEIETIRLGKVN